MYFRPRDCFSDINIKVATEDGKNDGRTAAQELCKTARWRRRRHCSVCSRLSISRMQSCAHFQHSSRRSQRRAINPCGVWTHQLSYLCVHCRLEYSRFDGSGATDLLQHAPLPTYAVAGQGIDSNRSSSIEVNKYKTSTNPVSDGDHAVSTFTPR